MVRVKFVHAVKYRGVRYSAHTPFDVFDSDFAEMHRNGAIVLERFPEPTKIETPQVLKPKKVFPTREEFMEMTVLEIKKYAKKHKIETPSNCAKSKIVEALLIGLNK